MRLKVETRGAPGRYLTRFETQLAGNLGAAAARVADRGKKLLRADVTAAGLGQRLANAWRSNMYPVPRPTRSLGPSVLIHTNADKLIRAYNDGGVIRHKGGLMLAIPTDNVKGVRDGAKRRKMTPAEVEALYDQDLTFIHGPRGVIYALIDKGLKRRKTLWRKKDAAKRGAAPEANQKKLVLMFVLVRQVRLRKRLNVQRDFATIKGWWLAELKAAGGDAVRAAA